MAIQNSRWSFPPHDRQWFDLVSENFDILPLFCFRYNKTNVTSHSTWMSYLSTVHSSHANDLMIRFPYLCFFSCHQEEVTLQFGAKSVDKKDVFGKSDPFLVFSKQADDLR